MEKRAIFGGLALPLLLLGPQLLVTIVFFYWPASQAVWQSVLQQDAFGLRTEIVWFENYRDLLTNADYFRALANTIVFAVAVTVLSLSIALFLATQADKSISGAGVYRTLLIWPYAVAPAVAGVPRQAALDWIGDHEPDRGWYAGPLGWMDLDGHAEMLVALRSALLSGARALAYAGCGIVEGSSADAEYAETELKLAPMLGALGAR